MNRLHFLFLTIVFSLAMAGLAHAQTDKKVKPEEFVCRRWIEDGDRVFRTRFIEEEVLNPDGKKKIQIVLEVAFYTGYSWAANADSTCRKCRYTLQRVGAPDNTGSIPVITWKVSKTEGKDLLRGRLQKTVSMKLNPQRYALIYFSESDYIMLDSESMRKIIEDDDEGW